MKFKLKDWMYIVFNALLCTIFCFGFVDVQSGFAQETGTRVLWPSGNPTGFIYTEGTYAACAKAGCVPDPFDAAAALCYCEVEQASEDQPAYGTLLLPTQGQLYSYYSFVENKYALFSGIEEYTRANIRNCVNAVCTIVPPPFADEECPTSSTSSSSSSQKSSSSQQYATCKCPFEQPQEPKGMKVLASYYCANGLSIPSQEVCNFEQNICFTQTFDCPSASN